MIYKRGRATAERRMKRSETEGWSFMDPDQAQMESNTSLQHVDISWTSFKGFLENLNGGNLS